MRAYIAPPGFPKAPVHQSSLKKNWPRRLNEISRRLASWDQTTNDKWAILSFAQQNQPTHENAKSCKIYSDCYKNMKK